MANTENIEAKLAAYIDGELDSADRAEIEQHLAANPKHRQLIEELIRARQLLRDLPHESAPADMVEALQGQLERSVLLDDSQEPLALSARRPNRWPQVMALAAVLVLAAGLGVVIYGVLGLGTDAPQIATNVPVPAQQNAQEFALEPSEAEVPMVGENRSADATDAESKPRTALRDDPAELAEPTAPMAAAPAPVIPAEAARSDPAMTEEAASAEPVAPLVTENPDPDEVELEIAAGGPPAAPEDIGERVDRPAEQTLFLVVHSSAPAQASDEVKEFFASSAIAWQSLRASHDPPAPEISVAQIEQRIEQPSESLGRAATRPVRSPGPQRQPLASEAPLGPVAESRAILSESAQNVRTKEAILPSQGLQSMAVEPTTQPSNSAAASGSNARLSAPKAPETDHGTSDPLAGSVAPPESEEFRQVQALARVLPDAVQPKNRDELLLVKDLSQAQVAELNASLFRQAGRRQMQIVAQVIPAGLSPAAIKKEDMVEAAEPTMALTTMPVGGATAGANILDVAEQQPKPVIPATAPTTQGASTLPAATQPAESDRLNVVIVFKTPEPPEPAVLQREVPPPPTTAPVTRPSALPVATQPISPRAADAPSD